MAHPEKIGKSHQATARKMTLKQTTEKEGRRHNIVSYPESRPIKNRILRATKGASIEEIINFKLLMKKTQFTEQKIVAMLKQHEQGLRAVDIARANGISEKTLYRWKSKYGGMDIKELKRVKELEAENSKLKRMYADLALMNEALKDVIEKKL